MALEFDKQNVNEQGFFNLPQGVHEATWEEFCDQIVIGLQRIKLKQGMMLMLQISTRCGLQIR